MRVKFSDDGCFAMVAHSLSNLAHLLQRCTAGPTKKGGIVSLSLPFFFAGMADALSYLIDGEELLTAGTTKGSVALFGFLGLLKFHVQPSMSYEKYGYKESETCSPYLNCVLWLPYGLQDTFLGEIAGDVFFRCDIKGRVFDLHP